MIHIHPKLMTYLSASHVRRSMWLVSTKKKKKKRILLSFSSKKMYLMNLNFTLVYFVILSRIPPHNDDNSSTITTPQTSTNPTTDTSLLSYLPSTHPCWTTYETEHSILSSNELTPSSSSLLDEFSLYAFSPTYHPPFFH